MTDWRDYILQHFQTPSHRLTLVADPDGLMIEEQLLSTIRANGLQLIRFDDAVQFRYAYESQFRNKWDLNEETELVVVLHSPRNDLRHLPFDLLQVGRQLRFQLSNLLPNLSYPVVRELDHVDLVQLYTAYEQNPTDVLGDQGTRAYLLEHVFGVALDTFKTVADVLEHLLRRHYVGQHVPASIDRLILERWQHIPGLEEWPLATIIGNRSAFFEFLQSAWPRYLANHEMRVKGTRESSVVYSLNVPLLPLDDPHVSAYVDSLFLEGYLRPIPVPADWELDGWTNVGVIRQPEIQIQLNFENLVKAVRSSLPTPADNHQAWIKFARAWAKLVTIRHQLSPLSMLPTAMNFNELQLVVETNFAEWTKDRYLGLHNYPAFPEPIMLHQISHYLAGQIRDAKIKRVALVVIDGLSLGQWLLIEEQLATKERGWSFADSAVFAWVPTLTSVSRQSIFAALTPLHFPTTWNRTDREAAQWYRFWIDQGFSEKAVGYFKGPNLDNNPELDAWLQDPRSTIAGLVINQVDDIMHGMQLGTAGMQQQVQLWIEQGHLSHLFTKLQQAGFAIFVTADHGNISAKGIGEPRMGALVSTEGKRALQFSQPTFLAQAQNQYPDAIPWHSDALPEDVHVLLASGLDAFYTPEDEVVCHGGISLEEVIVPFVQVVSVPA